MFYTCWLNMELIGYITHYVESRHSTSCHANFLYSERRGDLPVTQRLHESFSTRWIGGHPRACSFAPRTVLDVGDSSYWDTLLPILIEVMADRVACVAFPAEHDERSFTLNDPGDDSQRVPLGEDLRTAIDREKKFWMLCLFPVPPSMKQSADVLGLHYRYECVPPYGGCIDNLDTRLQLFWYRFCGPLGLLPGTFRHAAISGAMLAKIPSPNRNLPR